MKTIQTLGVDFNKRHSWLMTTARRSGLALCGGCAAAITKGDTAYAPKDIDFVATKAAAVAFISKINEFLLEKSVHYRVYANSRNRFVPSAANAHFRITCGYWLPVCLFVLPDDGFRAYRIKGGHSVQIYSEVRAAADELTEVDAKPRIANSEEETVPVVVSLSQDEESDLESFGEIRMPVRVGSGTREE
jgi:hypothetical protein